VILVEANILVYADLSSLEQRPQSARFWGQGTPDEAHYKDPRPPPGLQRPSMSRPGGLGLPRRSVGRFKRLDIWAGRDGISRLRPSGGSCDRPDLRPEHHSKQTRHRGSNCNLDEITHEKLLDPLGQLPDRGERLPAMGLNICDADHTMSFCGLLGLFHCGKTDLS
jgi:hypothetical protein